jgi:superfamily II DNA or RNA helicase
MLTKDEIQLNALNAVVDKKRSTAAVSMGVGKTLLGLKYIEHFQNAKMFKLNVLVVAPKKSIIDSWKDEIVKHNISKMNLDFTTYLSLPKQNPGYYDIVVLDECHSILPSSEVFLDKYNGRILGLTGTPPRYANSEKGMLINKYCPVVFTYLTDDAIDNDILNDYRIIVHRLSLSSENNIEIKYNGKSFLTSEEKSYEYQTKRVQNASGDKQRQFASILRMRTLMMFSTKETYVKKLLNDIEGKCLLFCNTQNQADRMCNHSYHSANVKSTANLQMFKEDKIELLSCVNQLSEGVNIPNLSCSIIMHSFGNERKLSQKLGRTLRLNPNEIATIHVLCYRNTIDEKWVTEALKDFDIKKIKYIEK